MRTYFSNVHKMCAKCAQNMRKMCAKCDAQMCTKCAQNVQKVVHKMCTKCAQNVHIREICAHLPFGQQSIISYHRQCFQGVTRTEGIF